jgi:hypothetical protein
MYRIARPALVTLAAALLTGCDDSSTEPRTECPAVLHVVGTTVQGTLDSGDCSWLTDNQYADFYDIVTTASGPLNITLQEANTRMGVAIVGETGRVWDERYAAPGTPVSAFQGSLPAGRYFAVVIGYISGQTGSYTINSSTAVRGAAVPLFGCETSDLYVIGEITSGTLGNAGCLSDVGQNFNLHEFTVATTRTVTFRLEAPRGRDAFIYLFDEAGTVLATRDDGGVNAVETLVRTLQPGTYYVGASDYLFGATGSYVLSSQ